MEWKYCVIEHQRKQSDIILMGNIGNTKAPTKQVWNIVYSVPFDPDDLVIVDLAFRACLAWVENNKVDGSEYLINEMFFI